MKERTTPVLVLTHEKDRTAGRVADELRRRDVGVVRADTGDFPRSLMLSAECSTDQEWTGLFHGASGDGKDIEVDLRNIRSVYYRRPTVFKIESGMSGPEQRFAYGEARFGLGGVLQAVDCPWLNRPEAVAVAEYKPRQLSEARKAGLAIPRTVITNDPEYAYEWAVSLNGPFIYKPLSGVWHPEEDEVRILYTTKFTDPGQVRDAALTRTAHMFQEWVPKKHEARAVVVGEQVFAVAIHASSNVGQIDWRADYDSHTYELITLPDHVTEGLVRLHRNLGLTYGACDLVATPEGEWVFLETNPNGEWEWLEGEAGAPITTAIADILEKGRA